MGQLSYDDLQEAGGPFEVAGSPFLVHLVIVGGGSFS
jgi:hypothetical protein